jgi:DNA-binding beta-propeller fold protein YncE
MVILDSNNGRVIGSLPIGPGPDDSAYDPETRLVYTSNGGDGTVSIIQQESPDNYRVVETVETAPGARNMALDLKTKRYSCHYPTASPHRHRPQKHRLPGAG